MELGGKVVVVTGGAGRLGREFCVSIARAGGVPVVSDINADAAEKLVAEIRGESREAVALPFDICSPPAVEAAIKALEARYGRVDAVVNNAYPRNPHYGRTLKSVEYADFCDNLALHLGGYFLVAQKFALHFEQNGGGNIVNIASIYGVVPPRFDVYEGTSMTMPVEYAVIKSGLLHLTRYFAQHFKKRGIRCNAISPGGIEAGQPAGFLERYAQYSGVKGMLGPADISGALVFLLSDASRWMTGQNLVVDDGFSL